MTKNCLGLLLCMLSFAGRAQTNAHLVYIDEQGVMRYTGDRKEASFFGVNYTLPFAHGFRMHQKLGIDHKRAIDADVHHMHRLGLNAFRVHVWDTEISDSAGNLLENEHLDLYDYLLSKLESNGIKVFLTPLAYWGNGYPEPDEKTGSFASIINNKQKVLTEEWAVKAQENYLKQLLEHRNPYTKKKYGEDRNVIALEINNEPHHTGPKEKVAEYISRMVKAVRSTGWTKPVFYNISESPAYADVVANSDIEGVTFQWYPTGLVANRSLKGNYLPHVDQYRIPFRDTIPAFRNKALMVYEFDAADVADSYMYPAMARSFRTAGFQWATQFAYDPLHTAHFNTEYQTHYLNLLYTPSKAISLLIASKVFQKLPRLKSYGSYPQDTLFDVFRLSPHHNLSEMNEDTAFYYSNTTTTVPRNISKLKHIAGVGSSPVVQYEGSGAYFLDKLTKQQWRLEVMPDAISMGDPFARASPKREFNRLNYSKQKIVVQIPELGSRYLVYGINEGTELPVLDTVSNGSFHVTPGVYYLLQKSGVLIADTGAYANFSIPGLHESLALIHEPASEVNAYQPLMINMTITGIDSGDKLSIEARNTMNLWKTLDVHKRSPYQFSATIPADMLPPGILYYRVLIEKENGEYVTFPGGHKGYPYAWDNNYLNETWSTYVMPAGSPVRIFDPVRDREKLMVYNPDWRNNLVGYSVATNRKHLVQWMKMSKQAAEPLLAWQLYFGDLMKARSSEIDSLTKMSIRGRSLTGATSVRVALIDEQGSAYEMVIRFNEKTSDVMVPLADLKPSDMLLLPAAYPRFMPKTFKNINAGPLKKRSLEKLEVRIINEHPGTDQGVEIEFIQLIK